MKKKLLSILFTIFSVYLLSSQIVISTTSTSSAWSPTLVTNSGATLKWSVSGGGISIPEVVVNDPTFDLSGNTGTTTITLTSDVAFSGLTQLDFYVAPGAEITSITGIDQATDLINLNVRYNQISSLDVTTLSVLDRLVLRGNGQFANQSFDTSGNPSLNFFQADWTGINSVDFSTNSLLTYVQLNNARLTSAVLDQIVIDLDSHGLSNGELRIANQTTGDQLTSNSFDAFANLLSRGWTIDVSSPPAPQPPDVRTIVLTTTSTSSAWSPTLVTNSGATLKWSVSGGGISIPEVVVNDPTFDLSGNTGTTTITLTSDVAFSGLTQLDFYVAPGAEITSITGIDQATDLVNLNVRYNQISSLDVTALSVLDRLVLRGNGQFADQSFDTSGNPSLNYFQADWTGINSVDFSTNSLLTYVQLNNARLTSAVLDQIVIDLDSHGLSNGELRIANQTTGEELTFNSLIAFNNLISKGWTLDVSAPAPAPGPEINITGNGISISNGNTPDVLDGTDFGQVGIGNSSIQTFTIENLGDADLLIQFAATTGTYFAQDPQFLFGINLGTGASTSLDVSFTPLTTGFQTGTITIQSTDPDESPYIINLTAEGIVAPTPEVISVLGNGIAIANGSNVPEIANGTDFGDVVVNANVSNTFTIQNDGTADLTVTGIDLTGFSDPEFNVANISETLPFDLIPGASMTFDVVFNPSALSSYDAFVSITHSDTEENPFEFSLTGVGVQAVPSGDIMISQFYNGFSVNDKWVEVKNLSGQPIVAGTYFLALYDQNDISGITSNPPTQSIAIPAMGTDDVLLFKNPSAGLPQAGNLGSAVQISTAVCDFNGDDVILISTSNDLNCYANREDIVGTIPSSSWGEDTALIKGGCGTEIPHLDYDPADWIRVNLNDVDQAQSNTNIALGTQVVGPTEFDGTSWSNLIPDQSREVVITQSFTGAGQSIEACNITINAGVDVVFDSNGATKYSIIVYGDLNVNGSLVIGDTESLVTYDPNANLGVITKIEKSTDLLNVNDVTYWSSPVQGSVISSIFSGVDQSRIFELRPADQNPIYVNTIYEHWFVASGVMSEARGYAAPGSDVGVQTLAFTGTPFNGSFARDIYYKGSPDVNQESDNFNLIGNPYPSAIDIQLFLLNNSIVNEIFLWTHATVNEGGEYNAADYVTYNLSGGSSVDGVQKNIGSGQGFMIRSTGFGSVAFDNGIKMIEANDQFFKASNSQKGNTADKESGRFWLTLTDDQGLQDDILIAFNEESTDGMDLYYDSFYVNYAKSINLYSQIDNNKLVIQGLGKFESNKEISLGIDTENNADLVLSLAKTEGVLKNVSVYLVDNELNVRHNLSISDYIVTGLDKGSFPGRFTIEFDDPNAVLDVVDIENDDFFSISNEFDTMTVNSKKVIKEIKVYDMLGRLVLHEVPDKLYFQMNTSAVRLGTVMVIEAQLEDGTIKNTKSIKY